MLHSTLPRFALVAFLGCAALARGATTPEASPGLADFVPIQPSIPDRRFSLTDFGAVGDGHTLATEAFRQALAAVAKAGGGTLVVPAGRYLTGPIDLCSRLNLHLEAGATIVFSGTFTDYPTKEGKYRPLMFASKCDDLMISGTGTIYGSGEAWWPEARRFKIAATAAHQRNNTSPRPKMVVLDHCHRVRVEGVTLTHAPVFNLVPVACEEVTIDGITILNPVDALNTDGIDPSVSRRVLITRCHIDTGDDCIAVKAGGAEGGLSEDILITDCAFFHGHGCSIGSETYSGLRRMTVRHCTFEGTEIGVRLKSDRARGGLVEDVTYTDLTMKGVGEAIVISSYYQGSTTDVGQNGPHGKPVAVTGTTPHWHNITVSHVTSTLGTKDAGMILGLPEMPADQITLEDVHLGAPKGLRLAYVNGVTLRDVKVISTKDDPIQVDPSVTGLVRSP